MGSVIKVLISLCLVYASLFFLSTTFITNLFVLFRLPILISTFLICFFFHFVRGTDGDFFNSFFIPQQVPLSVFMGPIMKSCKADKTKFEIIHHVGNPVSIHVPSIHPCTKNNYLDFGSIISPSRSTGGSTTLEQNRLKHKITKSG